MKLRSYRKLANRVKKIPVVSTVLKPIYKKYINILKKKRNKQFLRYGIDVLCKFDHCLTSMNIPYSLAFGSMLGAAREKGFIKHDLDLDVVIWNEDYTLDLRKCLLAEGFTLVHEILVDGGNSGREETYSYKGVTIDVFSLYPAIDKYPYCCVFYGVKDSVSLKDSMEKYGYLIPQRIQMPWIKEFVKVPFESLMLPITKNAHELLSYRYGVDYMKPNPNWQYYSVKNDSVKMWNEKKGILKY